MEYNTLGAVDLGSNSFHLAIGRVVEYCTTWALSAHLSGGGGGGGGVGATGVG